MAHRLFRASLLLCLASCLFSARVDAMVRLGSRVTEFHASYGTPSFQENLGRTSNLHWRPLRTHEALLREARAFALEVAALDGAVCQVAVRCGRSLSNAETARLAQHFLRRRYRAAEFAAARRGFPERIYYKLKHGDYVASGPFQSYYIIVVSNGTYSRHIDVFDREAARVRPPASIE